jgi:hypothetical protein
VTKIRADVQLQSAWVTVPYSAGDFAASTGTWNVASGDVSGFKYRRSSDHSVIVQYNFQQTSVSTAGAFLRFTIPGGLTVGGSGTLTNFARVTDNGAPSAVGLARATAGTTYIELRADLQGAGFAVSVDNTNVSGTIEFEV